MSIWVKAGGDPRGLLDRKIRQTSERLTVMWQSNIGVCSIFASKDSAHKNGSNTICSMDQYLLIPFLGGWTSINPSYFDVHQGYKVYQLKLNPAHLRSWFHSSGGSHNRVAPCTKHRSLAVPARLSQGQRMSSERDSQRMDDNPQYTNMYYIYIYVMQCNAM